MIRAVRRVWRGLCVTFLLSMCTGSPAREVYVAATGDNQNPGTQAQPFATISRARDALREDSSRAGSVVWIGPGTYALSETLSLDERDSGSEGKPVVYRSRSGDEVRITGGVLIDPREAKPVSDPKVRSRIISEEARDKILQIDLNQMNITDLGQLRPRGFRRPYAPAPLELFVNDEPLRLSRWPNDGVMPIGEVLDPGSIPRDGDFSDRGGRFTYAYDRPALWKDAQEIWLSGLFGYGYADDTLPVASIDVEKRVIAMAEPHMYGIKSGSPWHAYYALNLLEEIDEPGEYFVDRQSGMAYFYPPDKVLRIAVSLLEGPLVALEGASHARFQGLTFEVTRGMGIYIERGSDNLIAGCTLRNMGIVGVCIGMGIEPDTQYRHEMTGTPASRLLGSWHEHIYANSVFDRKAGTQHGVVGCDIYNTGAGGVHLGGGDREQLTPGGNFVSNCHIHHFNRLDRSYKAGVNIDGVGNRIEGCLIHDAPNSAIYLHGNDHVIQLNEVYRACVNADDMGVFYMGRDPSEQGNVIRNNFFHHNGNDEGSTTVLYFDDDSCGTQVIGNVFYKNKGTPTWVNHGCDHAFIGNLFIDNGGTVQAAAETRAYDWTQDELQQKRLRQALDITKPPYPDRYPRLLETYNTPNGKGRGNDVWRNLSVRSGDFGQGTNDLRDNLVTDQDPGFVDASTMNFARRQDAEVYRKMPTFEPIPFDRIGLHVDEFRRSLPAGPSGLR